MISNSENTGTKSKIYPIIQTAATVYVKKIVLFSRNDLTHLYGGISKHMKDDSIEIIHLAYNSRDKDILVNEYNAENVINYHDEIALLLKNEKPDPELIQHIDYLIIEQTNNRFCLNSAIQSDRTFAGMDYDEILLLMQVYYKFWLNLILDKKFSLLLHEPVAHFSLQIASVICSKYGAEYLTQIQVFGENDFNWIFVDAGNGSAVEMPALLSGSAELDTESKKKVDTYLANFRKDFALLLPEIASKYKSPSETGAFRFFVKITKTVLKHFVQKKFKKQKYFLQHEHIESYGENNRLNLSEKLKNQWDAYFHFKYDEFDPGKKYLFYPMHTEPEAVVLYWGDGLYKNQIKLIENIAAQLPPEYFLYVKYHPVIKDERNFSDFKRLKAVPNIKVIKPDTPGKQIVYNSCGVVTINGTAGFEGVLLNKPVFVFGNSFYDLSDRVIKIKSIRDLREKIYQNTNKTFKDDKTLLCFVKAFLEISHTGYIAYFSNFRDLLKIKHDTNIEVVSREMYRYLSYDSQD